MEESSHSDVVKENGVEIAVTKHHDNPTKCRTFYNSKMKICREFVLAALWSCSKFSSWKDKDIKCLDAFAASGIGGLQWKTRLKHLNVTLNDLSKEAVQSITHNCALNDLSVRTAEEEGMRVNDEATVEVLNQDVNVLLHQRQFHFIHIDPFGSTVQYLDSTFRHVYNGGVVVLTSTDVASLYGKCPQVLLRNYGAVFSKTDCSKEVAARIVLAQAARSAARCNKGLEVLYCTAVEHFVQVAVRIVRGATHADLSLSHVRPVLHCLLCEEWALQPDTTTLQVDAYSALQCRCHKEHAGLTAVILGPMWCGDIFNPDFIQNMLTGAQSLSLSNRITSLLTTIHSEAKCLGQTTPSKTTNNSEEVNSNPLGISNQTELEATEIDEPVAKRPRLDSDRGGCPMFYRSTHKTHYKDCNIPKMSFLIELLRAAGHRASRSHFDPKAVRTDATMSQLKATLQRRKPTT